MYWNSHLHFWVWFVSVCYYSVHPAPHTLLSTIIWRIRYTCYCMIWCMGWLCLVGSIKWWVSFAKEPYRRDDILQKRPIILSILLTVATPWLSLPVSTCFYQDVYIHIGWLVIADPYERDYILQKRPIIKRLYSAKETYNFFLFHRDLRSLVIISLNHRSLLQNIVS